jgi:hypothetical protein
MDQQIGAVDPTTNGQRIGALDLYCPLVRRISAVDPTTNGPADKVPWILLPMGQQMHGALDPTAHRVGR